MQSAYSRCWASTVKESALDLLSASHPWEQYVTAACTFRGIQTASLGLVLGRTLQASTLPLTIGICERRLTRRVQRAGKHTKWRGGAR